MAASVSGSKTVTNAVSPAYTASAISALLAIPVETLTVGQLKKIQHILQHVPGGNSDEKVIGTLLI